MNPVLAFILFWSVMYKSTEPDIDDADDSS